MTYIRRCSVAKCESTPRTASLVCRATSTVISVHVDILPPRDVAIGPSLERAQRLVLHRLRRAALHLPQPGLQSREADPRATVGTHMSSSQLHN